MEGGGYSRGIDCYILLSPHWKFPNLIDQDTRSCVSGQERRAAHKCAIKTHGRVSAAKKDVRHTSVLSRHIVVCQRPRKMCGTQMCYLQEPLSHRFQQLISL